MKKLGTAVAVVAAGTVLAAAVTGQVPAPQQSRGTIPSVEVRVRVNGPDGAFLEGLEAGDFQVFEDGIEQKVSGLYRIRGLDVLAADPAPLAGPRVARNFYLLFQAINYDPRFADAVQFMVNVLLPGDTLTLQTPVKSYTLVPQALSSRSKGALAKELSQILRKDIQIAGSEYRSILRDLQRVVKAISGDGSHFDPELETDAATTLASGLEVLLERYRDDLMKMETVRFPDEQKLLAYAGALRQMAGRKVAYLFYEREFRPEINSNVMNSLMSEYQDRQDILSLLQELFEFYKRDKPLHQEQMIKALADASLELHFFFLDRESRYLFGVSWREQSEDVFSMFSAVAAATGGMSEISSSPVASLSKARAASEDYYLLTYTPVNASRDRVFRTVRVAVAQPGVTVAHRLGYFAD